MDAENLTAHRSIKVIGHKHPDTDSICAAIAYARLKSVLDPERVYEPCRAGLVNRETQFVLDYFGVPAPSSTPTSAPSWRTWTTATTRGWTRR